MAGEAGMTVSEINGVLDLWAETKGDSRICVAVLDGPVDLTHPSFAGANVRLLPSLISGQPGSGPATRHGTHVASILFGQPAGPVAGIAPDCCGVIIPVFADGPGDAIVPCSEIDLARALERAAERGAHIINVSGGQLSESGDAHPLLAEAVRRCAEQGILIVAAAGNEGCACLHIPGSLPSVVAVGAMDSRGEPLESSNWGERYQAQGILAPGVSVVGASPLGGTTALTGTSYATPIVAGIAALLLSLQLKQGQRADARAIRTALVETALGCAEQPTGDCRRLLAGRLNVRGAVSRIKQGDTTMSMADAGPASAGPEPSAEIERMASASRRGEAPVGAVDPVSLGVIRAAGCSCPPGRPCACGATAAIQRVFVLGTLGIDFDSQTRFESLMAHMKGNPRDLPQLLEYLGRNPYEAASVIWRLDIDTIPAYAILPAGPFARDVYERLREFLREQLLEGAERVALAGHIVGSARLLTGETVPVVVPEAHCMYNWRTKDLIDAIVKKPAKSATPAEHEAYERRARAVRSFLERIYHELRSLGTRPEDRARLYAGTNALTASRIFEEALREDLQLDTIETVRSPICREGTEGWDVMLTFFEPRRQLERARRVYRFTVDVTLACPVMVGAVRSWEVSFAMR